MSNHTFILSLAALFVSVLSLIAGLAFPSVKRRRDRQDAENAVLWASGKIEIPKYIERK